ncbi:hypothetical protein CYMTET_39273 [Cymbomonas tetramitiformis]|uniref:Uncharacterized protein n=1 Tax=Cymbomonas tetramitiformis TaxID=36881 RepID=A0AAE0CAC7_9CHLO|nr:hypothetical protein CYMTET_39274 [Cymbomonas tetramitiformis]KAK3251386.1 hypothetical protein CYMTET_39273 [Cymbomonas tetramitiformis]
MFNLLRRQGLRSFANARNIRLDRPPPSKIIIEYDEAEVDRFIEFADAIEDIFPELMVDGNPEGTVPKKGAFEVSLENGQILFSKLQEDRFPSEDEVLEAIKKSSK